MINHSMVNNSLTTSSLGGKMTTPCPETGCHETFDDASLVFIHFITSHPFSYIRLKKRGVDALCRAVPGADKSCVVKRMRCQNAEVTKEDVWKKMAKNNMDVAMTNGCGGEETDDDDEISVVDEEIDLEIVKAYETLTMDGRRRQSLDLEEISQCSEKEKAPPCLSTSPVIDRSRPNVLATSTPLNAVANGCLAQSSTTTTTVHRSPSPSDQIATTTTTAPLNGSKKLDAPEERSIERDDDHHEEKSSENLKRDDHEQSPGYVKSSQKRRRSDCDRRSRSRSITKSRSRSLSPRREVRRQRSRSSSSHPKRSRRSSAASKSGDSRRSSSDASRSSRRRPRRRATRSRSAATSTASASPKRRRCRSPSTSRSDRSSSTGTRRSGSASPSRRRRSRHQSDNGSYCSSEDLQIPCLICAKTFSSPDDAYNHDIDSHVNFGRFPCIICKKFVAADPNKLQMHIENQHPARRRILKLPCPFCRQNFELWRDYHSHLEWDYSARRRRVYEEIWRRSSLQCSLCGAETGATDRRSFENHARDCRSLKENGGSARKEQPRPCCTRRHAERRGCIHFRTFCKKYPGCLGTVCDFAHPTCKFDTKCRTNSCDWFHTTAPRERCSMCGKNASSSSHDQSF